MALAVAAGRCLPVGGSLPNVQGESAGHVASDAFLQGGFLVLGADEGGQGRSGVPSCFLRV